MTTRMTLTAIALGTLVLSGCTTAGTDKAATPAEVSAPAAPAVDITAPAAPAVDITAPAAPAAEIATPVVTDATVIPVEAVEVPAAAPVSAEPEMKKDAMVADEAAMAKEELSTDDAAMNACFASGGQVVSWVGDPSGATLACRQEDGLEYRLADAQYYQ